MSSPPTEHTALISKSSTPSTSRSRSRTRTRSNATAPHTPHYTIQISDGEEKEKPRSTRVKRYTTNADDSDEENQLDRSGNYADESDTTPLPKHRHNSDSTDSPTSIPSTSPPHIDILNSHRRTASTRGRAESDEHDDDYIDAGSLSDTAAMPSQKQSKIRSKYRKKIRRGHRMDTNVTRLQRFKRIKRHKERHVDEHMYDPDGNHKHPLFRVSAFCTCDTYDLTAIIDALENDDSFDGSLILYSDVLEIKQKSLLRHTFIFTYGCVVFYNFSESSEMMFLNMIKPYEHDPVPEFESEDFDFGYGSESVVANDEITLHTHSSLEKLSVSFALAQCVKLSIYETRIAAVIESNSHLPMQLATHGSIQLSRTEISKRMGALFIERNNVNLHFDVLDSPEFFWEQDKYKHVYDRLFNYLELGKRVDLLNKRLDIMKELFDMLNDQLENFHAHKLEWIIIWLIVFEVIVIVVWNMLLKDILGFFPRSSAED